LGCLQRSPRPVAGFFRGREKKWERKLEGKKEGMKVERMGFVRLGEMLLAGAEG